MVTVTGSTYWLSRYCTAAMTPVLNAAGAFATLASQLMLMTNGDVTDEPPEMATVPVVLVVPLIVTGLAVESCSSERTRWLLSRLYPPGGSPPKFGGGGR